MNESPQQFSKLGFVKTIVVPALTIFLIPAISLAFFWHAQARYDADIRESFLEKVRSDPTLDELQRAEAIQFFTDNPMSILILREEIAAQFDKDLVFHYATFRWMIRLSAWSIVGGVAVLVLGCGCLFLSLHSPTVQLLSLSAGWNVLRLYAALQTVAQAMLLVALSYWVTALWFEIFIVQLIVVVGLFALGAVVALIRAIFAPVKIDCDVEGVLLELDSQVDFWKGIRRICDTVGTASPDQVIAGIDDNFFVTDLPVTVAKGTYQGRTLYISLALLKHLEGVEADAVLAHEMAHFSGRDTLHSRRVVPLLARYNNYLQGLSQGGMSRPVFYFMLCFRMLFELSLEKVRRERELRADGIGANCTSSLAMIGALLRIAAYSKYRNTIQNQVFDQRQVLQAANIAARIEGGFAQFATTFLSDPSVAAMQTAHPFDSHPPLGKRLAALGVPLDSEIAQKLLETTGDGAWHQRIAQAPELERLQWEKFESQFCDLHETSLPYRLLPETEEERAIVEKAFPEVRFSGTSGVLTLDYEKMTYDGWSQPLAFKHVVSFTLHESVRLQITYDREKVASEWIELQEFGTEQTAILNVVPKYHARSATAAAHHAERQKTQLAPPNEAAQTREA